ncbi:MAG TPA: hypothetical protein VGK31_05820 [Thermoanaerobaculia bacterium]|jgi:hypothetical protein
MKNIIMLIALLLVASPILAAYDVDLPVVTHVQGATTTFYTALDITNHSAASTGVSFEYISSDLSVDARGALQPLGPHGNFHTDDILTYLASQGYITAAQGASGFGTMLITFTNPTFTTGTEASASARIYNYLNNGQRPSVGLAYRALPVTTNGSHTVSTVIQDTSAAGGGAPSITTNLGLEDVGINDAGQVDLTPVTIQMTFYDGTTGAQIGPQPTVALQSGQVTQINNVWAAYGLPASTTNVVVVAAEISGTAQIRGYVSLKDTTTNDGSFFFMQ